MANCMIRADSINLEIDPVRKEITGKQQIWIFQVCDSDKIKSKQFPADKNVSRIYSQDQVESEIVVVDEISMEGRESENVHKSINTNKEKDTIDETEHEEPLVTDNPVINDTRYFNLFKCGKNILNKIDRMCE